MTISTLVEHIRSGEFNPHYIFCGTEFFVRSVYVDKIVTAYNARKVVVDSCDDLFKHLSSPSLLQSAESRSVYILYNDSVITSDKINLDTIDSIASNRNSIVIFVFTYDLDKRTKFYKTNVDNIVTFEPMTAHILTKYIRQQINLSESNSLTLADICSLDYNRILLEINKIMRAAEALQIDMDVSGEADKLFHSFLDDGLIYCSAKDVIFDFIDTVFRRKYAKAFEQLSEMYEYGENTLVILTNLYNSAKQLLQVQSYSGDDLAKSSGLSYYQIKQAKRRLNMYRNSDLVRFMRLISEAEMKIKTGAIDSAYAVYYVLINLWEN